MRCHYEILGLDIDCTSEDLKKAYRKLALEWHPDKNLDRLEEAKETFQLIQQAYDVLSDPQERAWYDRHRDDILRGGAEEAYKDDYLNVYQYFNTSCFKGYNDEEKGFYTVYREVFHKIAAEDKAFMDDEDINVPEFGFSYSSYDEVHSFYAYWQSYFTLKSYSWVDKFNLSESRRSGVGRQVLRLMEKENKKIRDQHKKLRNEEVRELVAFVRKRDKRLQAHKKLAEELKAEKARKLEEQRKKQIQERNKRLENYVESEWASMSQFEHNFHEIETAINNTFGNNTGSSAPDDADEDMTELYCPACEKDFKSAKAMKNHENSKKHKDNVILLKTLLEEEDESLQNGQEEKKDCDIEYDSDNAIDENNSSEALLYEIIKNSSKTKKKKKKTKVEKNDLNIDQQITKDEEDAVEIMLNQTHIKDEISVEENCDSITISNSTDKEASQSIAKSDAPKKKKKKEKKASAITSDTPNEEVEKPSTLCEICNTDFSSRNKLFAHLKESGHAVYKNDTSRTASKKKKKWQL